MRAWYEALDGVMYGDWIESRMACKWNKYELYKVTKINTCDAINCQNNHLKFDNDQREMPSSNMDAILKK